ncbi:hypothetical protein POPTR_005G087000v4 [Populus trichocarpa]|uniref:Uncharacterized protein n=1 Tax=Populus trichocarpa TaxID=3694 RepID=U5GH06_POPTR|nr:hypothetical protein BDE02_05G072500 [Populus trichocarpa]PNT35677.1 hypothetical protein POPTR_005G087000v4 [Populus trichocarpa]
MAKISRNHLVLVAFFLLCFVSTCARARTLREVNNHEVEKKDHNNLFPSKENGLHDVDELAGMDYTPASKKPPIHN